MGYWTSDGANKYYWDTENSQTPSKTVSMSTQAATPGPLDSFIANPASYASTSTSTASSGLPAYVATSLKNYLNQSTQNLSGYNNALSQLANPTSFTQAYKPIYKGLLQKSINSLNSRGMLNSNVASDAISGIGNNVTSQYLQQLQAIASLFGNASELPVSIADTLKTSTSSSSSKDTGNVYATLAQILQNSYV